MDYVQVERIAAGRIQEKEKLSILLLSTRARDTVMADWPSPPIGAAYVSAALKKAGKDVYTINLTKAEGEIEDIVETAIKKWDIDVLGFGTLIMGCNQAETVFRTAKRCKPNIITYLGGGGITCSPDESMNLVPDADIGMLGEGEITACEMMDALETGGALKTVRGLLLREPDGRLYFNEQRDFIQDLDALPWPDWDGFDFFDESADIVSEELGYKPIKCAPLVTSRGCPFHCTFCSKPSGDTIRYRSLDSIFAEIEYLVNHYEVNRFICDDDLFAEPIKSSNSKTKYNSRLEEFCVRIKPYNVLWAVTLRVGSYMTEDLLQLMKESGCSEIFYGIESGDDDILRSMKKGISTQVIEETVRRTCAVGINTSGNIILGDPKETMETVQKAFSFAEKLKDQFSRLRFNPIVLYPGSELHRSAVQSGKIKDKTDFIRRGLPLVNLTGMSDEDYDKLVFDLIPNERVKRIKYEEPLHRPEKLLVDQVGKMLYFHHTCPDCGETSTIYLTKDNLTEYTYRLCPKCGKRADYLAAGLYAERIDDRVQELLRTGETAIWGAAYTYIYYRAFSKVLNEMEYLLVDNNPGLQRHGICGHKVYAPTALQERGIHSVILMASDVSYNAITQEIRKKYPVIENIYGFHELAF